MFGFVFGSLCLAGLVAVAATRPRRWGRGFHRGWGGYGILYGVLGRLETTPGQEKVIREALNDLKDKAWHARDAFKQSRHAVAQAVQSPGFDEGALRQSFAEQDATLHQVREAFVENARKVHEVLDEKQRGRLSDMLASGPFFWPRHFGRHAHHHGYAGC